MKLLNKWLLVSIWATISLHLSAQILTAEHHFPTGTDSLSVYKLPYQAVTDSGRNCVWDFSGLTTADAETIDFDYFVSPDMSIGLHREHANYYFSAVHDTLRAQGYETSKMRIEYDSLLSWLCFPLAYGDTLSSTFSGKGQYCHTMPLTIEGERFVKADATGQLLLPDMAVDTALRVYSHMIIREDSLTQVQDERYQWYSPYCRYPLFETVSVRSIHNDDTVLFASSYYLPQEQEDVPERQQIQQDIPQDVSDSLVTDVTYLPNPVYNDLHITYSLTRPAQVYISLHYSGGISTYQTPIRYEEEGAHSVSVNMGGMPIGTYVVYIHADDLVVSGNIVKF